MRKREDFRLQETEKLYDAVERQNTEVKDYSLQKLVRVFWRISKAHIRKRHVVIEVGKEKWTGNVTELTDFVNMMIDAAGLYEELPRVENRIKGVDNELVISTLNMPYEALRDHVAEVRVNHSKALLDLEELLKATRYA